MGMLVTIRESWAHFLRTDVASGAHAYFSTHPVIPIYTEKLKTIDQSIIDALSGIGLSVVLVTVTAKDAQNQIGGLYFNHIIGCARVLENPTVNDTGIAASDLAEAVAWFSRKFTPANGALKLQDIMLAQHPSALAYDVFFTMEAGITTPPRR